MVFENASARPTIRTGHSVGRILTSRRGGGLKLDCDWSFILSLVSMLYLCCIYAVSMLYLCCIYAVSMLYLCCILVCYILMFPSCILILYSLCILSRASPSPFRRTWVKLSGMFRRIQICCSNIRIRSESKKHAYFNEIFFS